MGCHGLWEAQTRSKMTTKEGKYGAVPSWNVKPGWDQPRPTHTTRAMVWGPLQAAAVDSDLGRSKTALNHIHSASS